MADPAVQFVRVCYGEDYRIVTFYQDQPIHELRELLGALFPGTTSAHGRRPIAIERLVDGQVVPLSSATKFPQVMSHGNWELLVTRANTLRTEKLVIAGFLQDMLAHGFVTPGEFVVVVVFCFLFFVFCFLFFIFCFLFLIRKKQKLARNTTRN
jgi:hypothetical protein